ncbi:hypothetical protein THAR02_03005 [Trichoderma harzianum]|uniref:Uncharacterized protein n=1 Tax=Trichoderma harzianum TaxID=5544 RepID=A0A0G0AJ35_TRIHA|nr:hypothetical protein THAR02_03005 [Trichoderma harzianum]
MPIIVIDDDLVHYEKASKLTVDPTDARAFAIYEQLLSVEVTTFDPAAKDLVSEKLFKKCAKFEENLSMKQKLHDTELTLERS